MPPNTSQVCYIVNFYELNSFAISYRDGMCSTLRFLVPKSIGFFGDAPDILWLISNYSSVKFQYSLYATVEPFPILNRRSATKSTQMSLIVQYCVLSCLLPSSKSLTSYESVVF